MFSFYWIEKLWSVFEKLESHLRQFFVEVLKCDNGTKVDKKNYVILTYRSGFKMFWSWPHFSNCVLGIKNSHLFRCNISMVWFCFSELNFKLVMARTGVDLPKGLLFWKRISFDVFAPFSALRFVMNVLNKTGTKCAILSKLSLFGYSMVLSRINSLFFLTFFSYLSLNLR